MHLEECTGVVPTNSRRARDGQTSLAARALFDEAGQERKIAGKIGEHGLQIALDRTGRAPARPLVSFVGVSPQSELARDGLLDRLAIGQIGRAARTGADEVGLVQGEALGERRHLDQAAQALRH